MGDYPAFEPACLGLTHDRPATVLGFSGASKVLDPFHDEWPRQFDAKVIWIDRDKKQQAKSQIKFLREVGGMTLSSQAWRPLVGALRKDRFAACDMFLSRCRHDPLLLRFEDIIDDPMQVSLRIAGHIGIGGSSIVMARCVLKRKSDCAVGMEIEFGPCTPPA